MTYFFFVLTLPVKQLPEIFTSCFEGHRFLRAAASCCASTLTESTGLPMLMEFSCLLVATVEFVLDANELFEIGNVPRTKYRFR